METEKTPEYDDYRKKILENAKKNAGLGKDEKIDTKDPSLLEKAATLAKAVVSRGINNNKAPNETIKLRDLSCHGDGDLAPCSERKDSQKYPGSFYCGACGCGDKKMTQLVNLVINGKKEYSKIDYPKVSCPFKMPGFSDYVPSQEGVSENSRKKELEKRYGVEYITEHSNPK
jgi:hypothetical protein